MVNYKSIATVVILTGLMGCTKFVTRQFIVDEEFQTENMKVSENGYIVVGGLPIDLTIRAAQNSPNKALYDSHDYFVSLYLLNEPKGSQNPSLKVDSIVFFFLPDREMKILQYSEYRTKKSWEIIEKAGATDRIGPSLRFDSLYIPPTVDSMRVQFTGIIVDTVTSSSDTTLLDFQMYRVEDSYEIFTPFMKAMEH